MKFLKNLFNKVEKAESEKEPQDEVNYNYICLSYDPINTVNDLRIGKWDMRKVQEGLAMGMNRYAYQSEVDEAKRTAKIVSDSEM